MNDDSIRACQSTIPVPFNPVFFGSRSVSGSKCYTRQGYECYVFPNFTSLIGAQTVVTSSDGKTKKFITNVRSSAVFDELSFAVSTNGYTFSTQKFDLPQNEQSGTCYYTIKSLKVY